MQKHINEEVLRGGGGGVVVVLRCVVTNDSDNKCIYKVQQNNNV